MNPSGIDANESEADRSSGLSLNYLQRYALAILSAGVALAFAVVCGGHKFLVWRPGTCGVAGHPVNSQLLLVLRGAGPHHLHLSVQRE